MRPRSYARKPTDAHTSSRTHSRTYTYIHPRMHMYARIRAREGNFLTSNLLYSITKPRSIISLEHAPSQGHLSFQQHSLLLFNRRTICIHIGTTLAAPSVQTVVICHLSDIHYHPLAIVSQLSANYPPLISYSYQFIITPTHHLTHIIFHLYLISNSTHHPINMSVCYKTLLILYIFAAFSSAFSYTTVFSSFISLTDSL